MDINGDVLFGNSTWCLLVWLCLMLCIQMTLLNSKRPWLLPYRGQVSHQREGCGPHRSPVSSSWARGRLIAASLLPQKYVAIFPWLCRKRHKAIFTHSEIIYHIFSFLELCQVYTSYSCTWGETDSWRRHKGRLPQRQICMPAQWWKAVFQDQFEKQTMIRYDCGRSGLRWRTMSPKQRAEWIVTHPVLQRMAKLMENMFVEDKNLILGNDCHSTSENSTDSIETTWDTY